LAELPVEVAEVVRDLGEDYRLMGKNVTVCTVEEGYQRTMGEGERIEILFGERRMGGEMVHSDTVGATGVHYDIGAKTPPMPAGTWFVLVYYYSRYWMQIANVVPKQIEE
jgi:hypothetical protein